MAYNPNNIDGQATMANSAPVVLASDQIQDLYITGAASQSASGNNILLASAGTAGIDSVANGNSYRSFYVQVNGSSGIAGGAVIFEGSNDNTNWLSIPYSNMANQGNPSAGAFSPVASTNYYLEGKLPLRYFRVRISTVFTGGTVQAYTRLSTEDYSPRSILVAANTATNASVFANLLPRTTLGCSMYTGSIAASATAVKASAGQVYGWHFYNSNSSAAYVQFFNTASGSVTLGTTAPVMSIGIPATSAAQVEHANGLAFGTAITVACTTTRSGSTAPTNTVDLNIAYA